jgi:ABC-2 type transport system permease protein
VRNLFTIAIKDVKTWLRDPAALGVLLGMPVILILILGSAMGGLGGGEAGGGGIAVAIVDLDVPVTDPARQELALGREITMMLAGNEDLSALFAIEIRESADEVRTAVERGELAGALIVPENFSASVDAGDPVELEVLRDPGSDLSAGIWESVVRSVANDLSRVSVVAQTGADVAARGGMPPEMVGAVVGRAVERAMSLEPAVSVEVMESQREGRSIGPLDYYSLSMSAMFLLFGAMFGAFSFITERREQTMARLLATPTARSSFIGGKMLGIFLLGMVQFAVLYAYTSGMMRVDWGGNVTATWLVAAAELAATAGLAVLIASIARTERGAGGIGPIIIQIMALLGGAFFPLTILPDWLQPVRYISVVGWALDGFQAVQMHGAGIIEVLPNVGALFGFAVLFFGIGVWRLKDAR